MKKAVVIGGGIAGASITKYLASRGVGVNLFERSPQLCSGATWHAAGLVTRFGGSSKIKRLHSRSLQILTDLHDKYDVKLHTPGSIRIVEKNNRDRLKEAHQHVQLAKLFDLPEYPTRLIGPDEIKALHPLINLENVECGIHTPTDGDIDPTSLTNCVINLAKANGAVVECNMEVIGVTHLPGNRFSVKVENKKSPGNIKVYECDILINAGGLWSKYVTELIDPESKYTFHPGFIIEHQYAITEEIPFIKEFSAQGKRLPVLRDLKASSYIRQERYGLLIGPYEKDCRVKRGSDNRGDWTKKPPADWGMELFPDHLTRIEENILTAAELIPELAQVGIINCTNGPTIWTGDSLARCGRTLIPNYYDFNTLTYGIAQSLPLSEYLGHIILEGEQEYDAASDFDPLRYQSWANEEYTYHKVRDTYSKNNVVTYGSFENRQAGREFVPKHSLYESFKKQNASFVFSSGVETPAYFTDKTINYAKFDHHEWQDIVQKEAENVVNGVGISHASFSKIRVSGTGSHQFLEKMTTNLMPTLPGRCRLTYTISPKGKIVAEWTITKEFTNEESFYLVGSRDYAAHDYAWLNQQLRLWGHQECGKDIKVENISDDVQILHIAGPRSRELLVSLSPEIENIKFLTMTPLKLGGHTVNVFRVSFSGCQGYELHFDAALGPQIFDLIVKNPKAKEVGLSFFGSYALNSLRIEKGFKIKSDLDYAHYKEAGIEPFISAKKPVKFIGYSEEYKPTKRAKMFFVHTESGYEWSVPGDCPILSRNGDKVVGYTTTAAFGAITKQTIAQGYVYAPYLDSPELGDLHINCYGKVWKVTVLDQPPRSVTAKD